METRNTLIGGAISGHILGERMGAETWKQIKSKIRINVEEQARQQIGTTSTVQIWDDIWLQVVEQVWFQMDAQIFEEVCDRLSK